jgi:peptidoglycan/xylan/chitin deacetylase (PgdA/CDA1 family)
VKDDERHERGKSRGKTDDKPNPYRRRRRRLFILVLAIAVVIVLAVVIFAHGPGKGTASLNSVKAASGKPTVDVDALLKKGIRPNELGMVMIMEYHRIADSEGSFTRSINNFKNDLETLYAKGYRLARYSDFLSGHINTPAGTTPIIFTFDDSTVSQFRYIEAGGKKVIDPNCAVGIMEAFYHKHPDFGCTAVFSYLPSLFEQEGTGKEKVQYLATHGFEFADHTVDHAPLGKLSDQDVQKEIVGSISNMKSVDPKVDVDTLCLPDGVMPKNQALMYHGSYDGSTYNLKWVLLVGSNPMYPQYNYKNPGAELPRIQVMDYDQKTGKGADGSGYWLAYFDKHPELRFVSDGDPLTICAPGYMEPRLLPSKLPKGVQFVGYEQP